MVDLIKPSELDPATTVFDDAAMVVDDGGIVQRATPVQVVDAGAPVPTENEALAGSDNTKRMTALRVRQVLDNEVAPAVLRAQAWAESATPPDPLDPTSKSSKSWAAEAAISEDEAQDHADSAAGFAADALAIKNQLLNDLQADATTLAAGVPATASYDPGTLTVSFGIPTGPQGAQGIQGDTGSQGPAGTAATIAAGTTNTGAAGTGASVTNSGTSSAAVFDFTIPRGDTGATGATGSPGAAATVSVGTTTTGAAGSNASVTNSGTSSAAVFSFTIPRGDTGATGATGIQGIQGPQGDPGPPGTTDWNDLTNKPTVIGAGATQAAARTAIGLGSLATVSPTGTASANTSLYGDNTWGWNASAVAGGVAGAPRVSPAAIGNPISGSYAQTTSSSGTTYLAFSGLSGTRSIVVSAQTSATSNTPNFEISFSSDDVTWGANQTVLSIPSNTLAFLNFAIDLVNGQASGSYYTFSTVPSSPFALPVAFTVPVNCTAVRFRCSASRIYTVSLKSMGGAMMPEHMIMMDVITGVKTEYGTPSPHEPPPPDPKLTGIDFNGTMCSATADDQNGLAAVLVAIQFQGQAFQPTRFHFSNGNTLVISLDNWQDFAAVWLPFRQSFFAVEE